MPDAPDPVARINALTTNARNTWFVLLGVLVFVAITLMGVQHIDFYGVDRATQLPLVNVEVPTWLFFYAAPLLVSAVYGYFHLYLIRLWDALGDAPPRLIGDRLGDAIAPWLVTDAALHLRARMRKDNCVRRRAMEWPAAILNVLLAWVFGLGILTWTWVESLPARNFTMTAIAAICLLASLTMAYVSLRVMWQRMIGLDQGDVEKTSREPALILGLACFATILVLASQDRENGDRVFLAAIDLAGTALVERPDDWLPHYIARREFRATWCQREQIDNCQSLGDRAGDFDDEWTQRRTAERDALRQPHWSVPNPDPIDLRGAKLSGAFLTSASLSGALLEGADLSDAMLEGADLSGAQMEGVALNRARMERTNLSEARMLGANLSQARMEGANLNGALLMEADLYGAQMQGADLSGARMNRANLRWARMDGADLRGTHFVDADLSGAKLDGAVLSFVRMKGTDLSGAQMQGADLSRARMAATDLSGTLLTGTSDSPNVLRDTNFNASTNNGGALRSVDLTSAIFDAETDWRNVFLDGTVSVAPEFRDQMNDPCQWTTEVLTDKEFFARWRGWLQKEQVRHDWSWTDIAPAPWKDVTSIAPPENCVWQTGPLPDSGD